MECKVNFVTGEETKPVVFINKLPVFSFHMLAMEKRQHIFGPK